MSEFKLFFSFWDLRNMPINTWDHKKMQNYCKLDYSQPPWNKTKAPLSVWWSQYLCPFPSLLMLCYTLIVKMSLSYLIFSQSNLFSNTKKKKKKNRIGSLNSEEGWGSGEIFICSGYTTCMMYYLIHIDHVELFSNLLHCFLWYVADCIGNIPLVLRLLKRW